MPSMEIAIGLLATVLFCYFLAKSQPFRSLMWRAAKVGGVVILLAGAAGGVYALYQHHDEARRRTLIKPNEANLDDLTFTDAGFGSYKLNGTAKNTSGHTLSKMGVRFVLQDCKLTFDPDKYIAEKKAIDAKFDVKPGHVKPAKAKAKASDPWATPPTADELFRTKGQWIDDPVVARRVSPEEMKAMGFDKYPSAGFIYREGLEATTASQSLTCETIGESDKTVYLDVPPGQVRAVSESVWFTHLPPLKNSLAWMLVVDWVEAS